MLVAEQHAGILLVAHALLGAATVAVATHLVVWMRGYLRGDFRRHRAVRRFATMSLCLFAANFALGNLIYPTYKVRVRAEYLDSGSAVVRDYQQRVAARTGGDNTGATNAAAAALPGQMTRFARWFDVKEHWVALGLMLAAACALTLRVWRPREHGSAPVVAVFAMAVGVAVVAWLAAITGLVVSSIRAVGGIG